MDQLTAVSMLRQAARAAAASDDIALRWLSNGISSFLAGETRTLDAALGLQTGQSQRRWQTVQTIARRDAFIQDAARFFDGSDTAKARAIAAALHVYSTRRWPRDRRQDATPEAYRSKIDEILFLVLAASEGRAPPGAKQVLRILRKRHLKSGTTATSSHVPARDVFSNATSEERGAALCTISQSS